MRRARAAGTKTNSCGVWRLRSAADWGDPRGPVRPGRHIARNADTWSSCIATPPPRRPSHVQSSLQETGMMQSGFRLPRPVLLGPLSEPPPNSSLQPVSTGFGFAWRASPDVPCRHSWRHSSGRLSPVQHFPLPPRLQKSSSCLQNGPDPSRRSPIFISLSPFRSTPSPARPPEGTTPPGKMRIETARDTDHRQRPRTHREGRRPARQISRDSSGCCPQRDRAKRCRVQL